MNKYPKVQIVRVFTDENIQNWRSDFHGNERLSISMLKGDKFEIVTQISERLCFPYKGKRIINWDYFRDCINDLSWLSPSKFEIEIKGLRHSILNHSADAANFVDILMELNSMQDDKEYPLRVALVL